MWLDVGTRGCYEMFRLEPGHAHMDLVRVPGKRLIAGSWMTWGKRQEQPRLPELAAPSWPVHHYILNYDWLDLEVLVLTGVAHARWGVQADPRASWPFRIGFALDLNNTTNKRRQGTEQTIRWSVGVLSTAHRRISRSR